MKRFIQLVVSAFIISICATALADNYSKPIPVGSDSKQVQSYGGTYPVDSRRTEAQSTRFFDHPRNTTGATPSNFDSPEVTVPGVTTPLTVMDIMGLPGLRPEPAVSAPDYRDMLDVMIRETYSFDDAAFEHEGDPAFPDSTVATGPTAPMYPAHGFCPPRTLAITGSYYMLLECDVSRLSPFVPPNSTTRTDRQLELADVKNFSGDAPWDILFGGDPLEASILGSDQEISPYKAQTYPATIMSTAGMKPTGGGFVWEWLNPVSGSVENLADPYTQVLSYGFDTLGAGRVTASYDPVYVHKILRMVGIDSTTDKAWDWMETSDPDFSSYAPETRDSLRTIYSSLLRYMPLIFYRPLGNQYKLTGYTSLGLLPDEIDTSDIVTSLGKYFWDVALRAHVNPIDVDTLKYKGNIYVAVLNQATLGSLDQCYRDDLGRCAKFKDGSFYPWRKMVGRYVSPTELAPLNATDFPHKNVSWITIWQQTHKWINDMSDHMSDNPNEFLEPKYFALVGPGAFFATSVKDMDNYSLIVASGEETKDGFYLYKISPEPDAKTQLFFDPQPANTANNIQKLPGIIPEAFKIKPPEYTVPAAGEDIITRPGFVPYEIHAGNFDGDAKCDDLAITYRGKTPTPSVGAGGEYLNKYGEYVVFDKNGVRDHRLFSNVVTILVGAPDSSGTKCVYKDVPELRKDIKFDSLPLKEIPTVSLHDFDGDGIDDLLIGNLNPEAYDDPALSPHATRYTAFAYLVKNPWTADASTFEANKIRLGFYSSMFGPADTDMGQYLRYAAAGRSEIWGGHLSSDYIPGVGSLAVDRKHNISSVNGFPVMLPTFDGCAMFKDRTNGFVDSIIELLLSIGYDKRNSGVATAAPIRDIAPMRCSDASHDMSAMLSADKKEMIADSLYDSKAPYIASMNALTLAQALNLDVNKNSQNAPQTTGIVSAEQWTKLENLLKLTKMDANNVKKAISDLKVFFAGEPQSLEAALIRALLPVVLMQFETPNTNVKPAAAVNAVSAFLEKIDLVKEAWAGTYGYWFRLARGQPRPPASKSEMTVVLLKPSELLRPGGLEPFRPGLGPRCGNGHVETGEECETDADCAALGLTGHTCTDTCQCWAPGTIIPLDPGTITIPTEIPTIGCGDGTFNPSTEDCEFSTTPPVTCESHGMMGPCISCRCTPVVTAICGDGTITPPEQCESLSDCPPGSTACTACHCVPPTGGPVCGNGTREPGEECEALSDCPAGSTACAGCSCVPPPTGGPVCGNGTREAGEECESLTDCPAGSTACTSCNCVTTPPGDLCENSTMDPGELCDPTTDPATWLCPETGSDCNTSCNCVPPSPPGEWFGACGDGTIEPHELCGEVGLAECPEGQTCTGCVCVPGSGLCGNGSMDAGELCDESVPGAFWSCPVAGSTCVGCTCIEPGATPACGNGTADPGEYCGEPGLDPCPAGTKCQGCVCVPEIPPVVPGDPCLPCEDGTICECSGACTPGTCAPPCTPCLMPSQDIVVVKCEGGTPKGGEKVKEMNRLVNEKAPGLMGNDVFCEPEATFKYWINVTNGAWPSVSATRLAADTINPALVGNIGNFAVVELNGQKLKDWTQNPNLPLKTDMIEGPTIILPVSTDISKNYGKATTLPVDLSAATDVPFGLSLSNAAPISPDIVTSYSVPASNTFEINNVFKLTIAAAGQEGKATGEEGDAVVTAESKNDPLLCPWSARCPGSEALSDPAKSFDKVDFNKVLEIFGEEADKCQQGVCDPSVFMRLHKDANWPLYTIKTFAFVNGMPAEKGMSAATPNVSIVPAAVSPPMEAAAGGGCNCDITATRPDVASVIALLIITALAATGFIVVRVRRR